MGALFLLNRFMMQGLDADAYQTIERSKLFKLCDSPDETVSFICYGSEGVPLAITHEALEQEYSGLKMQSQENETEETKLLGYRVPTNLKEELGIMTKPNRQKEQTEDAGCSYGYFTITKAKGRDTEPVLNCELPLQKNEYEVAKAELEKLVSISDLAEVILDFEDARSKLAISINAIDPNDRKSMKSAQAATEHFIESVVRTVTHFKRQLKTSHGDCLAKSFKQEISEIYDNGDAYALLYKLRNIYQHEGAIPLKLSRKFEEDGTVKSSIILDNSKILNGHIASYLNTKVKNYIRSNPEIDIHILTKEVFDQLSELMQKIIVTKLIDAKLAKTGSSYIDLFLKLDKPCDILFLTRMREINDADLVGLTLYKPKYHSRIYVNCCLST